MNSVPFPIWYVHSVAVSAGGEQHCGQRHTLVPTWSQRTPCHSAKHQCRFHAEEKFPGRSLWDKFKL